ncbi:MAG: DUF4293 domain-containing protein [Pseudoflavonifractor sp.]|nr:DUF4293 domain-containing protein [Alloprevotella sp.]MCM1117185.1 DUF4293 domain-containing protein [Pseudoflavonifractor sp.]
MVIQRVQTLYLLLSAIMMALFFFIPFGYIKVVDGATAAQALAPLTGLSGLGFIIPTSVAIFFSLLAIFLYKAAPTQKLFVALSALVSLAEAVMVVYVLVSDYYSTDPTATDTAVWGAGGVFLLCAIVLDISAYRGISRDQRLLRSYDRLR